MNNKTRKSKKSFKNSKKSNKSVVAFLKRIPATKKNVENLILTTFIKAEKFKKTKEYKKKMMSKRKYLISEYFK